LLADKNWRKNKEGGAAGKKGGKAFSSACAVERGEPTKTFPWGSALRIMTS